MFCTLDVAGAPQDAEPRLQRDLRLQGDRVREHRREDALLPDLRLRPLLQARPDRRAARAAEQRGPGQGGAGVAGRAAAAQRRRQARAPGRDLLLAALRAQHRQAHRLRPRVQGPQADGHGRILG